MACMRIAGKSLIVRRHYLAGLCLRVVRLNRFSSDAPQQLVTYILQELLDRIRDGVDRVRIG